MQQERDETPDRRTSFLRLVRRTARVMLPLFGLAFGAAFLFLYVHYSRVIDQRLGGEVFQRTARIYAAPFPVHTGQSITLGAVTARLWRAGYKVKDTLPSDAGFFEVSGSRLTVIPKGKDPFLIDFRAGHIQHIKKKKKNSK